MSAPLRFRRFATFRASAESLAASAAPASPSASRISGGTLHAGPGPLQAQIKQTHALLVSGSDAAQSMEAVENIATSDVTRRWQLPNLRGCMLSAAGEHALAARQHAVAVDTCEALAEQGLADDSYADIGGCIVDLASSKLQLLTATAGDADVLPGSAEQKDERAAQRRHELGELAGR